MPVQVDVTLSHEKQNVKGKGDGVSQGANDDAEVYVVEMTLAS